MPRFRGISFAILNNAIAERAGRRGSADTSRSTIADSMREHRAEFHSVTDPTKQLGTADQSEIEVLSFRLLSIGATRLVSSNHFGTLLDILVALVARPTIDVASVPLAGIWLSHAEY